MERKKFSKEFNAKVAIEASKRQRTANQLAKEFDLHPALGYRVKYLGLSKPEMYCTDS
jgi:transposase-like protein